MQVNAILAIKTILQPVYRVRDNLALVEMTATVKSPVIDHLSRRYARQSAACKTPNSVEFKTEAASAPRLRIEVKTSTPAHTSPAVRNV